MTGSGGGAWGRLLARGPASSLPLFFFSSEVAFPDDASVEGDGASPAPSSSALGAPWSPLSRCLVT